MMKSLVSHRWAFRKLVSERYGLSQKELELLDTYLNERYQKKSAEKAFGVVFALTKKCNLICKHCAPRAIYTPDPQNHEFELGFTHVKKILDKLNDYVTSEKITNPNLIYGGGEPTLHPNIEEIVEYSAKLFGNRCVGINTNGVEPSKMKSMEKYLGFIEVSIDGLKEYHNIWRNPGNVISDDVFEKTFSFVKLVVKDTTIAEKLEVSSVLTKENKGQLLDLMSMLESSGVRNYSVHRPMPVGRMAFCMDSIPSPEEFIQFVVLVAQFKLDHPHFNVHLHHSLESIYSALLLGEDIHLSNDYMGNNRHSIGIDWDGNVHFDPWAMEKPFSDLTAGNLLEDVTLRDLLHVKDTFVHQMDMTVKNGSRCMGCPLKCSGGMRFNAIAHYHALNNQFWKIEANELKNSLLAVDPACPMYDVIMDGSFVPITNITK